MRRDWQALVLHGCVHVYMHPPSMYTPLNSPPPATRRTISAAVSDRFYEEAMIGPLSVQMLSYSFLAVYIHEEHARERMYQVIGGSVALWRCLCLSDDFFFYFFIFLFFFFLGSEYIFGAPIVIHYRFRAR